MRDDHPAEQYRAVMAGLDATPPPEPPAPPAPAPPPRPVVVIPPPKTDWWAIVRVAALPILAVLFALYLLLHAFI
jgi:hypothetical protein